MNLTIFCYSGTGNSLWTAKKIAESFDNTEVVTMTDSVAESDADVIGFVFPVHMWGMPRRVIHFLQRMNFDSTKYYFAVAVNAGQVSRTLIQCKNLLNDKAIKLSLGYEIKLPSNYIPWGGPGPEEKIRERIDTAAIKIKTISHAIHEKMSTNVERGPLWQRIIFTLLYKLSFKQVPKMDGKFFADEKCTSCGICEKVCLPKNITLDDGKPVWHQNCEQCLACIQWCPERAIQYGPKTINYERYHHPEIKVSEILRK